jgi:dCMP deaminase
MREDKAIKYFTLAKFQADLFSKDPSTKVCCLFLDPKSLQILSTGYNGMPRGIDETNELRWKKPEKYKYVVHAENNAIYNSSRAGVSLENSICVVTFFPCSICAKALIQIGISQLITIEPDFEHITYGNDFRYSLEMLNEVKIPITYV